MNLKSALISVVSERVTANEGPRAKGSRARRRREVITVLSNGQECAVNEIVIHTKMAQSAVSKHLGALHRAGVVTMVKRGRHRMYRLDAMGLKPVYDWAKVFEHYWTHQANQIKQRAERKALENG